MVFIAETTESDISSLCHRSSALPGEGHGFGVEVSNACLIALINIINLGSVFNMTIMV